MTNNNPTNLEIIKQACIKANPEIMELKLGCKALIYINSYLFAESIIVGKTESRVYFTREGVRKFVKRLKWRSHTYQTLTGAIYGIGL